MISAFDLGWAAGFIEGEGHFRFQINSKRRGGCPVVTADQVDRWPLDKLATLFGGRVYWRPQRSGHNGIHVWYVRGKVAVGVMMTLYSLMTAHRKSQIANSLAPWKKLATYNGDKTHCKRGHEFSKENTILFTQRSGRIGRRCRACDLAVHSFAARKERRLAKVVPLAAPQSS